MNTRLAGCVVGVILMVSAAALGQGANPPGNEKVSARFIAGVLRAKAGEAFGLAVEMKLAPGWHVYWKNPGEAGLATAVSLKLPEGVTADPWRYPTPNRFDQGGVLSYGYEGEVLLLTTVHVPPTWKGDVLPVSGAVKFLVCQEQCLPGRISLNLDMPVGDESGKANVAQMEKWGPSIPVPGHLLEGTIPAAEADTPGKLRVELPTSVKSADFFPVLPEGLAMSDVAVVTQGPVAVVTFKSKRLKGEAVDDKPVEAVLGYNDDQGRRRGVRVDVPVQAGR